MAVTTTSTFAGLLVETFSREKVMAPFERALAKFHDSTQDWPNEAPLGKGRTFGIRTKDAHSTGAVAEAGGTPTLRQPVIEQANVDAVQVVAAVGWSELMLSAGRDLGSLGPDVLTDHIDMTTRNAMQALNRLSLGHGTGRLGALNATANSATQVMRNPESVLQFRVNMLIDFYDTDTGGSKQGNSVTVNDIDLDTRSIVFSAAVNGTAGWGAYQALTSSVSTYGIAPFGLRAWADNGALTSSIAGITRSSSPGVNANVISLTPGTTGVYSEKLMRKAINRIYFACGLEPDEAWTNKGIISEHLNHLVGDRIFMLSPGDNVPKYRIGHNEREIGFQNGGNFIPYRCETDLPNREITFIKKSMFRRHQLRPMNWIGDDSGIDGNAKAMLLQLPASGGGYELSKVAILLAMVNYGNRMPKSICRVTGIADEELAGDTV